MKNAVTISRRWSEPQIFVALDNEGVALSLGEQDFAHALRVELKAQALDVAGLRDALKAELGSPALLFSKASLEQKIDQAFLRLEDRFSEKALQLTPDDAEAVERAIRKVLSGIKAESAKVA